MQYMIKILPFENGAHDNQTYFGRLPDGWAIIPDNLIPLKNFPFGEVEAEEINGVMTLTKWTAGTIPEPPEPQPPEPTEQDDVNAMLVDHELRIMDLELGITEE